MTSVTQSEFRLAKSFWLSWCHIQLSLPALDSYLKWLIYMQLKTCVLLVRFLFNHTFTWTFCFLHTYLETVRPGQLRQRPTIFLSGSWVDILKLSTRTQDSNTENNRTKHSYHEPTRTNTQKQTIKRLHRFLFYTSVLRPECSQGLSVKRVWVETLLQ